MSQYSKYPYVPKAIVITSNPSVGGAASEAMVVPGLLSTDTILSVTQKVQGSSNLPLLAFNTLVNNGLTISWVADPGPNAVVIVAIVR